MEVLSKFYKNKNTDKIYWVDNPEQVGVWLFSFDGKKVFNMFEDYPHNLTPEQKKVFDEQNPYWKDFFSDRN